MNDERDSARLGVEASAWQLRKQMDELLAYLEHRSYPEAVAAVEPTTICAHRFLVAMDKLYTLNIFSAGA